MSRPQNSCWILTQPKNNPLGPQKSKKDLKIKLKSKVRIEWKIKLFKYMSRPQNGRRVLPQPHK